MKILISLSASPILYHILNVNTAISVLDQNEFILTPTGGTEAESDLQSEAYYFSMTRHNLGKYSVGKASSNNVIFTLDGTKLSNTYKIKPVDYWGEGFRNSAKGDYEAEDRLLSNKPRIKNARKYIKSIRLMIKGSVGKSYEIRNSAENRYIRKLAILAKKHSIPLNIYTDKKAFLMDTKSKAIPISELDLTITEKAYKETASRYNKNIKPYIELFNKTERRQLSKEALELTSIFRRSLPVELVQTFQNNIHMDRNSRDHNIRSQVEEIIEIFRKNKFTALTFIENIHAKWKNL